MPSDAVRSDGASPDATVGPVLAPSRLNWARLLQRVFALDVEHCPNCGGSLKLIAAILDTVVIVKILTHLGLPARAPRAPARPLPGLDFT